jgi:hypothetical protein
MRADALWQAAAPLRALHYQRLTPQKPRGSRFTRRGRFVSWRVLIALVIFAAVVILAPFIYSIWMVISYRG